METEDDENKIPTPLLLTGRPCTTRQSLGRANAIICLWPLHPKLSYKTLNCSYLASVGFLLITKTDDLLWHLYEFNNHHTAPIPKYKNWQTLKMEKQELWE